MPAAPSCDTLPSAGTSGVFIEGLLLVGVHRSSWVWGLTVRGRVMNAASGTPIPESFKVHSRPSITNSSQYKLDAYTTQHITIFSKGAGGRVYIGANRCELSHSGLCFSLLLVITRLLRAFNIQVSILRKREGEQHLLNCSDRGTPFFPSKFHLRLF